MTEPYPADADPRRIVQAVITAFSRGPASRPDSGDRWDMQFINARGNPAAPRWDYPTREHALFAVSRLAERVGYPIPIRWEGTHEPSAAPQPPPPPASTPTRVE
jgi:hypothetical protein